MVVPSAGASLVGDGAFKAVCGLVVGTGDKTAAGSTHAESYTVPLKTVRRALSAGVAAAHRIDHGATWPLLRCVCIHPAWTLGISVRACPFHGRFIRGQGVTLARFDSRPGRDARTL